MAQILSVGINVAKRKVARGIRKTEMEDHIINAVGDIFAVIEDTDKLSPDEIDIFEVTQVQGMSADAVKSILKVEKRGFYNTTKNEEWLDMTDGKWKQIARLAKFDRSIAGLSESDKDTLGKLNISKTDKTSILQGFTNRIKDYPENLLEITIQ